MGLGGLEPPTSRLSSARSNQLSYKPLAEHYSLAAGCRGKAPQGRPAVGAHAPLTRERRRRRAERERTMNCHSRRKRNEGGRCRLVCAMQRLSISHLCSEENRKAWFDTIPKYGRTAIRVHP